MTALPADPYPPEEDGEDHLKSEYHALSYADLVERLFREFEDHVTLTAIADVVRESPAATTRLSPTRSARAHRTPRPPATDPHRRR